MNIRYDGYVDKCMQTIKRGGWGMARNILLTSLSTADDNLPVRYFTFKMDSDIITVMQFWTQRPA